MLHMATFNHLPGIPGQPSPGVQVGTFVRQANLQREDIINVQKEPDGSIVLFYWQEYK